MWKENSSIQILGFTFMRRLPWFRCWFLVRAEVDSSLFVKLLGRWRLAYGFLLPSRREAEASLATPALISRENAGSTWCPTASPGFPISHPPRYRCRGCLAVAEAYIEVARDVRVNACVPLLLPRQPHC
jgi:hypothetical protein